MDDILFDSRSELDKLPFGAVKCGETVRFGLRAAEALKATEVILLVMNDLDGETVEYELTQVWQEHGYARFEGSVTFEAKGLYWYHFEVVSNGVIRTVEKTADGADFTEYVPRSWQLNVYASDYTTPSWIMGGAFYHIFIDRFKKAGERPLKDGAVLRSDWGGVPCYKPDETGEIKNNDFFGGNLEGIIEKLPYLQELGISCIYLSPIFEAASNHKYDTADYSKIDPAFGNEAVFARLCTEAEKLGIRIICDGVFNHTGSDSVYFNRSKAYGEGGAYQTKNSPYYGWYSFSEWPEKYDAWWGIKTLPQIRKDCESFRSFITGDKGILQKWMSLGSFGWRLDVADELSENFLRENRKAVKKFNPEALIIGEVWEDASNKIAYGKRRHYFEGEELDSVMNYPFKEATISFMKTRRAEDLREAVETLCENYPKPALDCLMNILGTHDTERILTVLGAKLYETRDEKAQSYLAEDERSHAKSLLRLATALQFTLPGVPCIYYGDEAGLEGYEDPFNRRCYPWGSEDKELIQWYSELLRARKSCAAFAGGDYRTLRAENGVFAFTRSRDGVKVMTLVNMGSGELLLEFSQKDKVHIQSNCVQNKNSLRVLSEGCVIVEMAEA